MPDATATDTTAAQVGTSRAARIARVAFRAIVLLHAALVLAQPFLAGLSLDGDAGALDLHGLNSSLIVTVAMAQVPAAVLAWRPGRGTPWAIALTALLFAAETLQLHAGYSAQLALHLPLGVGIVLASLLLCALAFRAPRRRAVRPATGGRAHG